MSFLDGYEDVNARIKRARAEFPGLRLDSLHRRYRPKKRLHFSKS
jgi:hypothetical protein